MSEIIKSFKGFNKDMTCRGFQYEIGKEYEEEKATACKTLLQEIVVQALLQAIRVQAHQKILLLSP